MLSWKSVVGKLWMTIMGLVALVLLVLGLFLLKYIDLNFANSNAVKKLFVYTGAIGFLLTTFFALFLSSRITQPLIELKKAAGSISKGDYESKVMIYSNDEIGQLGQAFNLMAGQLEQTITDLKHEKEHLRSVLRSMSDAVITFDASGRIILVNLQGERLLQAWGAVAWEDDANLSFDTEPDELINKSVPQPLRELYDTVVSGTEELTSTLHVHNGVWSVVMTPLYTQNAIRGAVAVLRDVSEEYRLDKLRRDFVANVSHELRTPLSMLQGYSEALVDDIVGTKEERQELAQIILDESLRMNRLVENLLDLATMETSNLRLQRRLVHVEDMIKRVLRKYTSVMKDQHVSLVYNPSGENMMLYCDEDRIEQVLTNLVDNAIRHSSDGTSITIRSRILLLNGRNMVQIEVEDEGTGIHAEDLDYIFERFYKADKARTRGEAGGTGLGLAIVKNIVEAHGGNVCVRSTYGHGTTFSFEIPLHNE